MGTAPAFVAASRTVRVLCPSSHDPVESTKIISDDDFISCARAMTGVTIKAAQQLPSIDLVVFTTMPAAKKHKKV